MVRCCGLACLPGVRLPLHVTAEAERQRDILARTRAVLGGMDPAFSAIKVTLKANLHKIDEGAQRAGMYQDSSIRDLFCRSCALYVSQTWDRLLLPYGCKCLNRVKHEVFLKTIFLCLPLPRGGISLQRIKMSLYLQTLKLFDPRQDAAENFLYTADNFQLISVGAGSGLH